MCWEPLEPLVLVLPRLLVCVSLGSTRLRLGSEEEIPNQMTSTVIIMVVIVMHSVNSY